MEAKSYILSWYPAKKFMSINRFFILFTNRIASVKKAKSSDELKCHLKSKSVEETTAWQLKYLGLSA